MPSIGNIDQVNYNFIRKFKSFNGDKLSPNNEPYSSLVQKIMGAIHEIGEDCRNGRLFDNRLWLMPGPLRAAALASVDFVDSGEMSRSNGKLQTIFDSFSQAVVNLNDKVDKAKNSDELREVIEDFNDQFIFKLKFTATETQPGYRYISSSSLGPFSAHTWFEDGTKKDKIKDDNGSYKLIGQLVDRVYGMFTTTLSASKDIITKKNEALKGKGGSVTPQPAKPGENHAKTIDQKIHSLVTQKNRLAQRQASLIKTIRALTSEARTLYVRQFLNEDGTASTATSSIATSSIETSAEPTSANTREVDSNDPLYIGLTELINTKNRIEAYNNTSRNYFKNNILKRAKYLQSLMSGELKSNMSAEDRVKAFNNYNYDYDSTETKGTSGNPNATGTTPPSGTPTDTSATTPPSGKIDPLAPTIASGTAPTNHGPEPVPVTPKTQGR